MTQRKPLQASSPASAAPSTEPTAQKSETPWLDADIAHMRTALAEGRKALPACLPNPPVGCVLVLGGKVIAVGHTQPPGQSHAEALALDQVVGPLDDVTAYVTLEPCAFQGRTPSCAKTLIERGVKRIVVAMLDPDPRNDGEGVALMRQAGATVLVGLLADEARHDLQSYLALPDNR
jgi:pyrimidine deaminase RibD-like protein